MGAAYAAAHGVAAPAAAAPHVHWADNFMNNNNNNGGGNVAGAGNQAPPPVPAGIQPAVGNNVANLVNGVPLLPRVIGERSTAAAALAAARRSSALVFGLHLSRQDATLSIRCATATASPAIFPVKGPRARLCQSHAPIWRNSLLHIVALPEPGFCRAGGAMRDLAWLWQSRSNQPGSGRARPARVISPALAEPE